MKIARLEKENIEMTERLEEARRVDEERSKVNADKVPTEAEKKAKRPK